MLSVHVKRWCPCDSLHSAQTNSCPVYEGTRVSIERQDYKSQHHTTHKTERFPNSCSRTVGTFSRRELLLFKRRYAKPGGWCLIAHRQWNDPSPPATRGMHDWPTRGIDDLRRLPKPPYHLAATSNLESVGDHAFDCKESQKAFLVRFDPTSSCFSARLDKLSPITVIDVITPGNTIKSK